MKKDLDAIRAMSQKEYYDVMRDGLAEFYMKSEGLNEEKASRKASEPPLPEGRGFLTNKF